MICHGGYKVKPVYEYIYAVKTLGSFSKAANHLNVSQPALSISIKKLEEEINQPIFDRSVKPIALTQAGEILFSFIEELTLLESNAMAALEDLDNFNSGHIIIGGTQYFTAFILPELILSFTQRHPGVHIDIIESSSEKLTGLLNNNEIDLMFSLNEFNLDEFSLFTGLTDYLFIAIPKHFITAPILHEYCLTREEIIIKEYMDLKAIPSLNELKKIPFILLRSGNNLHDRSRMLFQLEGIMPPIKMALDQLTTAHYICRSGLAATLTTDQLIRHIDDNNNLLYLKYAHPLMIRNFNIIVKKNRYRSKLLYEFINMF